MDKRVERTKKNLQNSLAKLMMEKTLNQITVRELVNEAQINRSTFYLHYADVDALLDEVQNSIMKQLDQALEKHPIVRGQSTFLFFRDFFKVVDENREIFKALLGENGDISFLRKIDVFLQDACRNMWSSSSGTPMGKELIFYSFCMNGGLGFLRLWLYEQPEVGYKEAADMIYHMIRSSMDALVEENKHTTR